MQTLLSAFLGAVFSLASLIWNIESWSLLKQSFIHFYAYLLPCFPSHG
ncbi:DUF3021 family protein [Faecalicoccus pleomorphus]